MAAKGPLGSARVAEASSSSTVASSSSSATAHAVLRLIRRAKAIPQLEAAYAELSEFLRVMAGEVREAARNTPVFDGPVDGTGPWMVRVVPGKQVRLARCSMLVAAFSRRVEQLLAASQARAFGDVEGTSARGVDSALAQQFMEGLRKGLQTVATAATEDSVSAGGLTAWKAADAGSGSLLGRVPVISYGMGEIHDFKLHQRMRAEEQLRSLTAKPQWDVDRMTRCIVAISSSADYESPMLSTTSSGVTGVGGGVEDAGQLETTLVVTPLRDPLSQALLSTPARGLRCTHLELFDVASFVRAAQQRSAASVNAGLASATSPLPKTEAGSACPWCRAYIPLRDVRVDAVAVAAVQRFRDEPGPDGPRELTADHALEWDLGAATCVVVDGRRLVASGHSTALPAEEEDDDTEDRSRSQSQPGIAATAAVNETPITKKRRVEIAGHVLYVDD